MSRLVSVASFCLHYSLCLSLGFWFLVFFILFSLLTPGFLVSRFPYFVFSFESCSLCLAFCSLRFLLVLFHSVSFRVFSSQIVFHVSLFYILLFYSLFLYLSLLVSLNFLSSFSFPFCFLQFLLHLSLSLSVSYLRKVSITVSIIFSPFSPFRLITKRTDTFTYPQVC